MARSEEAIKRRALKRQRTEEEQRQAERRDLEKRQRKEQSVAHPKSPQSDSLQSANTKTVPDDKLPPTQAPNNHEDPLKEPGAWKCPKCGNENFASRNWCNSRTCDEARPYEFGQARSPPIRRSRNGHMDKPKKQKVAP